MAVRVLCGAGWEPAIPAVVGMLDHPRPTVRATAQEGLVRLGAAAVPALQRAAARARPDKRARYRETLTAVLAKALVAEEKSRRGGTPGDGTPGGATS
jgi:hypothetical protein